jgi:hypothetical protein
MRRFDDNEPEELVVFAKCPGYRWVECGSCQCAWQATHHAKRSVR